MNIKTDTLPVTTDKIREGQRLLLEYKRSKAQIEQRLISDEKFWNSRHSDTQLSRSTDMPSPASSWMFSTVINKHADILENIPSPVCLAREESDVVAANTLNSVLPVIFDRLSFNSTYSDAQYDKLKHGTAVYGVFWDPCAENGLGDIDIKRIDLLNLYCEASVLSLEDSRNVFYVSQAGYEETLEKYPWLTKEDIINNSGFLGSDDNSKCIIVDWYYKKKAGTRTLLHYVKFIGDTILYASENDEKAFLGFYEHGKYPFVLDILYRDGNSPFGYGLIAITKGTQRYIDKLDENILERSIMSSKPRYMMKRNIGLNRDEFLDWNNPIVEVEGDLSEERFKPITLPAIDSSVITVRDSKINEMREVTSNRVVNYGGADNLTSGVAIAAVQEAGNKVSRDIISGSWDAYIKIVKLVIELIRQFYTEDRYFRITRPNEEGFRYISFSGKELAEKKSEFGGETLYRLPVFDIEVRAQKSSVFSRLAQNELIINLFRLGFFKSENAKEAIIALDQMELEGKRNIIENLRKMSLNERNTNVSLDSTSKDVGVDKRIGQAIHSAKELYTEESL